MVICPIIYNTSPDFNLRTIQERTFQLLAMCLVALFVGNFWISSFVVLNVFLLLYNDYSVGLTQVLNVFLGSLIFMVSRSYFKNKEFMPYANVILWIGTFSILWTVLQSFGIDPLYIAQDAGGNPQLQMTFHDFTGLFGIKMANAIFIGLMLPVLATLNLWLTPLMLVPLYLCQSSVATLAIFCSMSFYLYHTRCKVFVWFFVIGLIVGSFYIAKDLRTDPQTFKSRFPVWHSAIHYTLVERPLGWGPDSYRSYTKQKKFQFFADYDYNHLIMSQVSKDEAMLKYYGMDNGEQWRKNDGKLKNNALSHWDNPHNEYIQMFFEYGFIGIILLIGLLREMYYRFKFAIRSKELIVVASCLVVYFVSGVGHFPLHLARLACFFPILLGCFYARTDEVTNE